MVDYNKIGNRPCLKYTKNAWTTYKTSTKSEVHACAKLDHAVIAKP